MALMASEGARAIEPLFTTALQQTTTARAEQPSHFLAKAAANLAGVAVAATPAASTSEASVQCSLPFAGHSCCVRSRLDAAPKRPSPNVREYLESCGVAALEAMMDATLQGVSASAQGEDRPTSDAEWKRLAASTMLQEAGLSVAPRERSDAAAQCGPLFMSHDCLPRPR